MIKLTSWTALNIVIYMQTLTCHSVMKSVFLTTIVAILVLTSPISSSNTLTQEIIVSSWSHPTKEVMSSFGLKPDKVAIFNKTYPVFFMKTREFFPERQDYPHEFLDELIKANGKWPLSIVDKNENKEWIILWNKQHQSVDVFERFISNTAIPHVINIKSNDSKSVLNTENATITIQHLSTLKTPLGQCFLRFQLDSGIEHVKMESVNIRLELLNGSNDVIYDKSLIFPSIGGAAENRTKEFYIDTDSAECEYAGRLKIESAYSYIDEVYVDLIKDKIISAADFTPLEISFE